VRAVRSCELTLQAEHPLAPQACRRNPDKTQTTLWPVQPDALGYLRSSLFMKCRPFCALAATLARLLPELPDRSFSRFALEAAGAPVAAYDMGPDRGVSQSSQRSRCRDVPA